MPRRRPPPAAVTAHFFPDGEDLPLFSGAPVVVRIASFVPAPVVRQEGLFDLRLNPFHVATPAATDTEEPPCPPPP